MHFSLCICLNLNRILRTGKSTLGKQRNIFAMWPNLNIKKGLA